jgi:hypothetical protein
MQTRAALIVVGTVAVASLLLGGVGIYHAGRLPATASPIEGLSLGGLKPWVDPDAEAAAFITGSQAVQPGLLAVRGRLHAGSEAEAEEGTAPRPARRDPSRQAAGRAQLQSSRKGAQLYSKIRGAAQAHERVRRMQNIAQQRRAILARIAAADGGVNPVPSKVLLSDATPPASHLDGRLRRSKSGGTPPRGSSAVLRGAKPSRTWLEDDSEVVKAARTGLVRGAVFARNTAPVGMSNGGAEKLGRVHLQNLRRGAEPARWGQPVAADSGGDRQADDGVEDVAPESEGMSVAGNGAGAVVQRLRDAVQGPSGIAELGETADEAYDGDSGEDGPNSNGNPDAGSWVGGQYHAGREGPDSEMSDAPWEFHGEPGRASNPSKMDSQLPHPGQVPDLLGDHIHNREFEDMLDECKGDSSCSALLSKGFWWLYAKPWRRCTHDDPYACIPYHCAANQEGTTSCKALQNNPIQALVDMDVRCWDKGYVECQLCQLAHLSCPFG